MYRNWLFWWLLLILLQGLVNHWASRARRTDLPMPVGFGTELLSLASSTNQVLEEGLPDFGSRDEELRENKVDQQLIEREELLLELRELENTLGFPGLDSQVSEDLGAWMKTVGGLSGNRSLDTRAYLAGLANWLEVICNLPREGTPPRARLRPPRGGSFPLLEMELRGDPMQLAERILAGIGRGMDWRLEKLQLNGLEMGGCWTIKTAFSYQGVAGR